MERQPHDLNDFMSTISRGLSDEYHRIQKRVHEDSGTAGDQGEENWATLLREWLPSTYHIVTKGRIVSHRGIASPQIDVLVLHPTYPQYLLRDKKLYLAGGVSAAFECKITLRSGHIKDAIHNAVTIKQQYPPRQGSPYQELHSPIIYGLLAHSHCWKKKNSRPVKNIVKSLDKKDREFVTHPKETLDILCVANLVTCIQTKTAWRQTKWISDKIVKNDLETRGIQDVALTSYVIMERDSRGQIETFTPVGAMLSHLWHKLAMEDPTLRRLADYFLNAHILGTGPGTLRAWEPSRIYTEATRRQLASGKMVSGTFWNEWSRDFL